MRDLLSHQFNSSIEELLKYATGLGCNYPEIDFSKRYPHMNSRDLQLFRSFSQIMKKPLCIAKGLKYLNNLVSLVSIPDPELALEKALTDFEQKHFNSKKIKDVTSELSIADFMKLVEKSDNIRDAGVSYFHGLQTHRIQKFILALHLQPKIVELTISKMANSEYFFINEHHNTLGGKEIYTLWDALMDRPAEASIPNKDNKPLSQVIFDEHVLTPHFLLPVCDSRCPEWLRFIISISEEIPFLKNAFLAEAKRRKDEIHTDCFISLLEIDSCKNDLGNKNQGLFEVRPRS